MTPHEQFALVASLALGAAGCAFLGFLHVILDGFPKLFNVSIDLFVGSLLLAIGAIVESHTVIAMGATFIGVYAYGVATSHVAEGLSEARNALAIFIGEADGWFDPENTILRERTLLQCFYMNLTIRRLVRHGVLAESERNGRTLFRLVMEKAS